MNNRGSPRTIEQFCSSKSGMYLDFEEIVLNHSIFNNLCIEYCRVLSFLEKKLYSVMMKLLTRRRLLFNIIPAIPIQMRSKRILVGLKILCTLPRRLQVDEFAAQHRANLEYIGVRGWTGSGGSRAGSPVFQAAGDGGMVDKRKSVSEGNPIGGGGRRDVSTPLARASYSGRGYPSSYILDYVHWRHLQSRYRYTYRYRDVSLYIYKDICRWRRWGLGLYAARVSLLVRG